MRLVPPDGSVLEVDGDQMPNDVRRAGVRRHAWGDFDGHFAGDRGVQPQGDALARGFRVPAIPLERHDELATTNRHFSFFWCPVAEFYTLLPPTVAAVSKVKREHDVCEMKVMNVTDEPPRSNEETFERVAYSSEIYPIEYIPNFHELEYAIPVENGKEALRQIRELMLTKHTNCIYPVEYRFVAGDLGMLSPYYQRASVTISISGGPGIDYWSYLLYVDAVLRQYGARPHWGKLHFNRAEDMPLLYPRFPRFPSNPPKTGPVGLLPERSFEKSVRVTIAAIARRPAHKNRSRIIDRFWLSSFSSLRPTASTALPPVVYRLKTPSEPGWSYSHAISRIAEAVSWLPKNDRLRGLLCLPVAFGARTVCVQTTAPDC